MSLYAKTIKNYIQYFAHSFIHNGSTKITVSMEENPIKEDNSNPLQPALKVNPLCVILYLCWPDATLTNSLKGTSNYAENVIGGHTG